jgi:hypothetical protein
MSEEDISEREWQRGARRRQWIKEFRERQRTVRDWIGFDEIAEWCARSVTGASAAAEEEARRLAYERLDQSARNGEFETFCQGQPQSKILYLHPRSPRHGENRRWLTREQLGVFGNIRDQASYSWLPCKLAYQWLAAHDYPSAPAARLAAPDSGFTKATKTSAVKAFIVEKYPRGIPPGVSDKTIAREFGDHTKTTVSDRTVRRARR